MLIRSEKEQKEALKNKRVALATAILLQTGILLLSFYIVAWMPPDPPIPQYGIEVNFGLDESGSGEKQPEKTSSETKPATATKVSNAQPSKTVESKVPKVEPIATPPVYQEKVEATKVEPITEVGEETVVAKPTSSVEKIAETSKETSESPKQEPSETILSGNEGQKHTKTNSHGNVEGSKGDQGKEEGTINSELLVVSDLTGRGEIGLDIQGWSWSRLPQPKDTSNESGKLVFEIKIDRYGEVIAIRTLYRSVSRTVADIYQNALKEASFEPHEGVDPAETTTGKVIFNIKVR
ncbi:MAG: hypothetical protein RMJ89_00795 [Flammeovirgaceae bacterium]|nr:hypothetical protein [Flammeovirgaceae bacterium]